MGLRLHRDAKRESIVALDTVGARIGSMLRRDPPMREGTENEPAPALLTLETEAKALLVSFSNAVELDLPTGKALETVRPFAAKL